MLLLRKPCSRRRKKNARLAALFRVKLDQQRKEERGRAGGRTGMQKRQRGRPLSRPKTSYSWFAKILARLNNLTCPELCAFGHVEQFEAAFEVRSSWGPKTSFLGKFLPPRAPELQRGRFATITFRLEGERGRALTYCHGPKNVPGEPFSRGV